jgi:hypothetical protein
VKLCWVSLGEFITPVYVVAALKAAERLPPFREGRGDNGKGGDQELRDCVV